MRGGAPGGSGFCFYPATRAERLVWSPETSGRTPDGRPEATGFPNLPASPAEDGLGPDAIGGKRGGAVRGGLLHSQRTAVMLRECHARPSVMPQATVGRIERDIMDGIVFQVPPSG